MSTDADGAAGGSLAGPPTVAGMTSDPSAEHRLTLLENDRDSRYDLMRIFRVETRAQFAKVDRRLDRIDGTLAEILRRLPESA